jgi:hypothetical protein
MKVCIITIFLAVLVGPLFSQSANDTLKTLLTGKKRYQEIEKTVQDFYSVRFKGKGSGYNQWLRWLYFNRDRVDANGGLVNISAKTVTVSNNLQRPVLAPDNVTSMTGWINLGPTAFTSLASDYLWGLGRIDRVAFHPTNGNIIYAGSAAGGLWRSSNAGASWASLTPELFTPGISGIVCSYSDPNILYVLTGEGEGSFSYFNYMGPGTSTGVYKSINGGLTWRKTGPLFNDNQYIAFQLIQHPVKPNVLYAATDKGIYATVNGGNSWNQMTNVETRDIVFHPQHPEFIYADELTSLNLLYITADSAATSLESSISGTRTGSYVAMAVSPNQPNTVMLLASKGSAAGDDFKGLYKGSFSYNASTPVLSTLAFNVVRTTPNILGDTSTGLHNGSQAWYDMCIALKPDDANTIVTGGLCVWRSINQGTNINAITKYNASLADPIAYIHPDVHRVAFNPINNTLFACTDGGLYVSSDNGITWSDITSSMSVTQFYSISGVENNADLILGGTQDNGTFYRKDASANFKRLRGADGFSTAINPVNNNIVYWTENQKVYKSVNGGSNVTNIYTFPGGNSAGVFPEIRIHPSSPDTIIAFNSSGAFVSKNGGSTWNRFAGNGIRDVIFCPEVIGKVYIVYGDKSFAICTTVYDNFPGLSFKYPPVANDITFTKIAVFPGFSDFVWLGASGYNAASKVIFSDDGGTTWFDRTGSLPNLPINCMSVDANGNLYVGTDIGVFLRVFGNPDWVPFSNGLPRVPVTSIVINNTQNLIRISTLGRGVWSTNLANSANCNTNELVNSTYLGQYYFQAANSISSVGTLAGSAGTKVDLKAGGYILLQPGFWAAEGSVLTTIIGPCDSGIPSLKKRQAEIEILKNKLQTLKENLIIEDSSTQIKVVPLK